MPTGGKEQVWRRRPVNEICGALTVYFEDPFWVGVFERTENEKLSACKITFGAEPKDYEVWEFVLRHYYELKFSPSIAAERKQFADNPKRRVRNAKRKLQDVGIGTKSQQALAAQREETKTERKKVGKERRAAEQQRRFELKQQKRQEKHKGH